MLRTQAVVAQLDRGDRDWEAVSSFRSSRGGNRVDAIAEKSGQAIACGQHRTNGRGRSSAGGIRRMRLLAQPLAPPLARCAP